MKTAVIYARYSCDKQTEQSIEGQIHVIRDFAEREGYAIVGEYIDRAKSAKTAKRPEFLRMISDSGKRIFDYILVYKLDRFSRNRYDSAFYKQKLRANGVKLISATEVLSDNPESIITEALLEAMAEFYSAELGQKTKRGMRESALKCQTTGAVPPLGYKWGEDKKLHIDPATAEIPRIAFRMYADGKGKREIAETLNSKGYRTRRGKLFTFNSFGEMLKNKKYIGVYTYGDEIAIEGGCPALIDCEEFERVQKLLEITKKAPARAGAKVDYLLSGKLYCGICGEKLTGTHGTSRNGSKHRYYKCKEKNCHKKAERKDFIEWFICDQVLALLNMEEHRERIADKVLAAYSNSMEVSKVDRLERELAALDTKINNVADLLIEKKSDTLMKKLDELELQKSELEEQLYSAKLTATHLPTKAQIIEWFKKLEQAADEGKNVVGQVIKTFVDKAYLWDEKAIIVLNIPNTQETVTFEQIREFEMLSDDGSCNNSSGTPNRNRTDN